MQYLFAYKTHLQKKKLREADPNFTKSAKKVNFKGAVK